MAIDTTKVMTDIFAIEVDGSVVEMPVEIEFPPEIGEHLPIRAGPTGNEVLGYNVIARTFEFKMRLQEPTAANMLKALNVTGSSPAAVGAQLATHTVKLTPFGDGNNTRTIKMYAVAFRGSVGKMTGTTNYKYEITCTAMRDSATGKVWEWAVA